VKFPSVLILALVLPSLAQELPEEVRLLARIQRHIGAQLTSLEDYTCLQTSRRYRKQGKGSKAGRIESAETLTLEVAHIGNVEKFAWPGAGKFEDRQAADIVAGGLTDTGTFSLFARSLFQPRPPALIRYHGSEECQGRPAARYDFTVSTLFSGYTLRTAAGHAKVAYSGSFWADTETLDLCRLVVHAEEVPSYLGLDGVDTIIDYGDVRIGNSPLRLPQAAQTVMRFVSGDVSENQTDFTHCRRYTADSTLFFDTPPERASAASRPEATGLPAGLMVSAVLVTPIDSQTARVGDAISARVDSNVTAKRKTWLPAGTILNGRIRRLERFTNPADSVLIGLELTDFAYEGARGLFFADLQQREGATHLTSPKVATSWTNLMKGGMVESTTVEEFTTLELPGTATFSFPGKTCRLEAGTRMVWKTRELSRPPAH
jgi:hypothetical protein